MGDHGKTTLKKEITPTEPLISSRPTRASAQQPIDRYRIGPDGEPLPPPTPTLKKKEKEKVPLEESDIVEEKDKEEANNTKVKSLPEDNGEEKKNETKEAEKGEVERISERQRTSRRLEKEKEKEKEK